VEQAIIGGLFSPDQPAADVQVILTELKSLTETAGAEVVADFQQRRQPPDRRTLIGSGKIDEIRTLISEKRADLLILYNELNGMQQRNLEEILKLKVIDRTRLILDIFAGHAKSLEGKLQVELAQLLYLLPRLTGKGVELSRLGGGIGTRGPGETKLETNRRTIKKRIALIRDRLEDVTKTREMQRKKRRLHPIPVVSLAGYTSAGKSTLFNAMTGESVAVSSRLFSTLDPLLRKVAIDHFPAGAYFLLSDTVGFIRQMPGELFTSFKATLEEISQADIIVHVINLDSHDAQNQRREVEQILRQLQIPSEKVITVFNKIDLMPDSDALVSKSDARELYLSARTGKGIPELKKVIGEMFFADFDSYTLAIRDPQFDIRSLDRWAIVVSQKNSDGIHYVDVLCSRERMRRFKEKHGGMLV